MTLDDYDEATLLLAARVYQQTLTCQAGEIGRDQLPTSQDLARHLKLDHDKVKKKLKKLTMAGLIQAISYNPKRYQVDLYALKTLDNAEAWVVWLSESLETKFS